MNFVYIHFRKNDVLSTIKEFFEMTTIKFNAKVKFFRIDDERILSNKYDDLMKFKDIIIERTVSYTSAQNGMIERIGGIFIFRARVVRIAVNLSINLWPEIFKAVEYLSNRTSKKKLD